MVMMYKFSEVRAHILRKLLARLRFLPENMPLDSASVDLDSYTQGFQDAIDIVEKVPYPRSKAQKEAWLNYNIEGLRREILSESYNADK